MLSVDTNFSNWNSWYLNHCFWYMNNSLVTWLLVKWCMQCFYNWAWQSSNIIWKVSSLWSCLSKITSTLILLSLWLLCLYSMTTFYVRIWLHTAPRSIPIGWGYSNSVNIEKFRGHHTTLRNCCVLSTEAVRLAHDLGLEVMQSLPTQLLSHLIDQVKLETRWFSSWIFSLF